MTGIGRFLEPGQGARLDFGGIDTLFRVSADWVDGAYCVVEQVLPARYLVRPHEHTSEDQVAIVLSGEIGFRVGDSEFVGGAGAVSVRPRRVPHANWNPTDAPATMLEITSPGRFEQYWHEMAASGRPAADVAADWGISYVDEWIDDLRSRYGLRV
ncbi:cupin domain-containing protein [Spongiactinospora sp. 9N601]|uniref:cupin domain-containing protein n=1 Tax=Spongiactinospora sp. 9N601 TaxID=3375149 RepID=UPI0037BB8260